MAKDKTADPAKPSQLSLRIDLPNGSRLGPGKVKLLEAIDRCASISAAAREQGLSYRRAWLLIDDMNRAFREQVVETYPGRSQGKGAALTGFGKRLITLYRGAEAATAGAVAQHVAELEAEVDRSYDSLKTKPRRPRPDADVA